MHDKPSSFHSNIHLFRSQVDRPVLTPNNYAWANFFLSPSPVEVNRRRQACFPFYRVLVIVLPLLERRRRHRLLDFASHVTGRRRLLRRQARVMRSETDGDRDRRDG